MRASLAALLAVCFALLASTSALARVRSAEALPSTETRNCAIELTPASTHVSAGEPAAFTGLLTCPIPSEAAEQTITIEEHTAGTSGQAPVAEVQTDASGAFQYSNEALQSNSAFSARDGHARSRRIVVRVAPLLTIAGPSGPQLRAGTHHARNGASVSAAVLFKGAVSPVEEGSRVVLQRESLGGYWRKIAVAQVNPDGSYTIAHIFHRTGLASVRTVVRHRGQSPAISETLTYEVEAPQNPDLTLEVAPDPLVYGSSLTLDGTLAGGSPGTPVELFARNRSGAFAAVAEATTGEEGNYEFTGQMPLADTSYRVSAAGQRSVSRFVAVQPALSTQVSAETVPSSGSVTFSGTLTPSHPGEVIHLERRAASGAGYRVIAAIVLGEGPEFTLERTLTGSGTQTFRITVSAEAGLQATAGAPLAVELTPAETLAPAEAETPPAGPEA